MKTRFGSTVEALGDCDKEGYFKARLTSDESTAREREIHLGDVRTENDGEQDWVKKQCNIIAELRA